MHTIIKFTDRAGLTVGYLAAGQKVTGSEDRAFRFASPLAAGREAEPVAKDLGCGWMVISHEVSPEVTNALVAQNDELTRQINNAADAEELVGCKKLLVVLRPLWTALGYRYKVQERYAHLETRANELIQAEQEFYAENTRYPRSKAQAVREIKKLQSFVEGL